MDLIIKDKFFQQKLLQLLKFGLTGVAGLIIDFSVTWFCKEYLGWNRYGANACGFSIAVINNYIINRVWTFKSSETNITQQFTKFLLISGIGLIINTCCLFLIHSRLHVSFYPAKFISIVIVFIWNYSANSRFTFKK